jgi:tRNA pseudouridine32 synthase / 23S rRNA pseudouridine746 synthase
MTQTRFVHHLAVAEPESTPVGLLCKATGLSTTTIKKTMQKGAVWITRDQHTQRMRRAKKPLKAGDTLHVYYNEQILSETPLPGHLIADEGAYSVWYKPYGMRSQGSRWGDHTTIQRWAETHLLPERSVFTVHRLDRAATGLILIAHQKQTAASLSKMFELRAVEKHYRVVVHGCFPVGTETFSEELDGRSALSHATCMSYDPESNHSQLCVTIQTGRKHQIRRHLANSGYPVVGDRLYGPENPATNLQLTATALAFKCPISHEAKNYRLPPFPFPQK